VVGNSTPETFTPEIIKEYMLRGQNKGITLDCFHIQQKFKAPKLLEVCFHDTPQPHIHPLKSSTLVCF